MGETASKMLNIGAIKLKGIPMAVSNSTKVREEGRGVYFVFCFLIS